MKFLLTLAIALAFGQLIVCASYKQGPTREKRDTVDVDTLIPIVVDIVEVILCLVQSLIGSVTSTLGGLLSSSDIASIESALNEVLESVNTIPNVSINLSNCPQLDLSNPFSSVQSIVSSIASAISSVLSSSGSVTAGVNANLSAAITALQPLLAQLVTSLGGSLNL